MLSIGWVMFWKAMVVAVAVSLFDAWALFRKRRREAGLPLRAGKDGVYRVHDWADIAERRARLAFWIVFGVFNLFALYVGYVLITG